ncbi:hypothetical protein GYMLUDRAFT_969225 [Collybiopsis luxurians FD-317 M1]|uniref:Unplaced genomic scaffold GYMLUscaffold_96, whole genome shotgun sequence n=1 Tax=Collybiopsis luxurians FD-317 M1 TaxID=944289 RepID=A0A0D0BD02_9AGAR|nr:hypothetical protein GYMLUDRAFT_969225 [Collybiopsis luxurians FD-317 M1]
MGWAVLSVRLFENVCLSFLLCGLLALFYKEERVCGDPVLFVSLPFPYLIPPACLRHSRFHTLPLARSFSLSSCITSKLSFVQVGCLFDICNMYYSVPYTRFAFQKSVLVDCQVLLFPSVNLSSPTSSPSYLARIALLYSCSTHSSTTHRT